MTAPSGIITRIHTVDARKAEKFLSFEKQPAQGVKGTNRRFSENLVNKYAYDMLAGQWKFTHEGFAFIGFMSDGTADFKDGGQRTRAIIRAATVGATRGEHALPPNPDIAIDFMVTEGLDEDSWRAMNIGKPKNAGDFLAMDGEIKTAALGATIALCWMYENTAVGEIFVRDHWQRGLLTPIMRQEYLDANPGVRESLWEGSRLSKVMTVSSAAAGHYLALKSGMDKLIVADFMDRMYSGADVHKEHPVLRLRELLSNARVRNKRRNMPREDQLALFIKALKAFAENRHVKNLSFRTDSKARAGAEPFPRF